LLVRVMSLFWMMMLTAAPFELASLVVRVRVMSLSRTIVVFFCRLGHCL